jgi:hypothetical protein
MRSRVILAGLWVGLTLSVSGCGGGKAATTTPPAHVAQGAVNAVKYHGATRMVYVRPTTKTGLLRRGFSVSKTLTGKLCNASGYVPGAYRCLGGEDGIYDPCWPVGTLAGANRVFCPPAPWSRSGLELILAKPIEPYTLPPSPMPEPWAVKLVTGALCTKMLGAVNYIGGVPLSYGCKKEVLLGRLDRRRSLWTGQVMLPTITTKPSYHIKLHYGAITPIVEAWYGIGYPN